MNISYCPEKCSYPLYNNDELEKKMKNYELPAADGCAFYNTDKK